MTYGFYEPSLDARKPPNNAFRVLKENYLQPTMLYPAKLSV